MSFYEELYTELGYLFYAIANIDGRVRTEEKKSLHQLVQTVWKPLENSTDSFGTDMANFIEFSFVYENAEVPREHSFQQFSEFFHANRARFTPEIITHILFTAGQIANAYRGKNKKEQDILQEINKLFEPNRRRL